MENKNCSKCKGCTSGNNGYYCPAVVNHVSKVLGAILKKNVAKN